MESVHNLELVTWKTMHRLCLSFHWNGFLKNVISDTPPAFVKRLLNFFSDESRIKGFVLAKERSFLDVSRFPSGGFSLKLII